MRKLVLPILIALMAVALGCVPGVRGDSAGREFFLSPNGNDSGVGSKENPWHSLGPALSELQPGDTLTLRGGVYEEDVLARKLQPGTPERPILVRAAPGERPVLKGLLRLLRPTYWTFDGLNVEWDPRAARPHEHMVKIGDGVGWTFRNAELSGAQSYAALLVYTSRENEPRDWRVTGCAIHDTRPSNGPNQDHLIYVNSGLEGAGGRIDHNLLYNAPNGGAVKLGGPSATDGGAAGVTVEYNTLVGARQGVIVAWQSRGNRIRRNLIGRTGTQYAAIRGYQLSGTDNQAGENAVFATPDAVMNNPGFSGVEEASGNRLVEDPQFDHEDATGFHPRLPAALGYGRYAGQDK